VTMLMGDFNSTNSRFEEVMGRLGVGTEHENCKMLAYFRH